MIYNTTQRKKVILEQIDLEIGKPAFSFLPRKNSRNFSSKMAILETSVDLNSLIHKEFHPVYGMIETRPNGVLVHIFRENQENAWPITFNKLSIVAEVDLKISSPNNFLVFHKGYLNNKRFTDKLIHKISESNIS